MSMNFSLHQKNTLLSIAKQSIEHGLKFQQPIKINSNDYDEQLKQQAASFVTINIQHELRGCIGSLQAYRPLIEDVADNAFASAFRDPRFPPLTAEEFPQLSLHISVLTTPENFPCVDEADLLKKLRPKIDGLILTEGKSRATFLPSVWENLPDPRDFLNRLKMKAGLPKNYWSDTIKFQRYETVMVE